MIYISRETLRILIYRYKVYNTRAQAMCNDMCFIYYKESCDNCPHLCGNSCALANRLKIVR